MLTLIGNLPAVPMLVSAAGNLAVSLLRALFFLVAKRMAAALDELAAVGSVLGHPLKLLRLRRSRMRGRRAAYGRLRRDLPPGRSLRRIAEFAAAALSKSGPADTAGSHHATDDPDEADFLLTDTGLVQRILTNPGVLLFLGLTVLSLVAGRALLGSGPLGGGALVPAWGGAAGLWHEYLQGFHPVGVGSSDSAPPYLAVIALLATAAGGKPWLAVDLILLGCVPLAGISAFLAVRRVTSLDAGPGLGRGLVRAAARGHGHDRRRPDRHRRGLRADPGDRAAGRADADPAAPPRPPRRLGHRPGGRDRRRVRPAGLGGDRGPGHRPGRGQARHVAQPGDRRDRAAGAAAAVDDTGRVGSLGARARGRPAVARPGRRPPPGPLAAAAQPGRARPAPGLGDGRDRGRRPGRAAAEPSPRADAGRVGAWPCPGSWSRSR